jgi:voltage-gated potassium channel
MPASFMETDPSAPETSLDASIGTAGRPHHPAVYHVLLALTLLLIAVQPFGTAAGGLYARLVFGLVLIGSMAAVYEHRRLFIIGLALGIPALGTLIFDSGSLVDSVGLGLGIATMGFVCAVLLSGIYRRPSVSLGSVSASLVVYLMLGILWSMAYQLVETHYPGSFYGLTEGGINEVRRDLFYYSFVTLTTVGYGDIGPVGSGARALAITQAVVGQLYLVVLVASLVGSFLNQRANGVES